MGLNQNSPSLIAEQPIIYSELVQEMKVYFLFKLSVLQGNNFRTSNLDFYLNSSKFKLSSLFSDF